MHTEFGLGSQELQAVCGVQCRHARRHTLLLLPLWLPEALGLLASGALLAGASEGLPSAAPATPFGGALPLLAAAASLLAASLTAVARMGARCVCLLGLKPCSPISR